MPTDIPRPLSPNAQLQAENRVLNYFADANPDNDLFVGIDETALDNRALARTIQDRSKVQRISYDRGSGILRVCSMARPIHNAANNLLTRSLVKLIKADFFTEYEETRISTTIDGDVLPSVHIVEGSKKPQAWTRFPDAAIVFGAADEAQVPTVVFEVGFTEAYDDLQNDAAQWLKSLPSVQLVVMIDIREDVKTLRKIRSEKTVLNRLHDLVKRFGNWTSNDEHDSGSESDRSTPDLYSRINDSICSADFVGPLTVHLELWERSDGAPRLRQPAIAILPPPPSPNNPVLRITDIVPRHHLQSEHDTRSAELDMDLYRSLLDVATKKFAYRRAIKYLRPRKHQD